MNFTHNPNVRAVAAGVAAAVAVLIAAYAAGEGIAVVEWLTALLALLAGSGLTTAVHAHNDAKALRAELAEVTNDSYRLNLPWAKKTDLFEETQSLWARLADLERVHLYTGPLEPQSFRFDVPEGHLFLWNDTSVAANFVLKYWDGSEWCRMDGGGDIPDGMVLQRHLSDDLQADLGLQAQANRGPGSGRGLDR